MVQVLSQMTLLLDHSVIDPSQSLAFPMNVIALLPYMVQNYEDANELCIRSAENIAQVTLDCMIDLILGTCSTPIILF